MTTPNIAAPLRAQPRPVAAIGYAFELVADRSSALTWSITHGARDGRADRVLADVAAGCRAICRAHLPRASGYELTCARLSGPLDGVTLTVARANFRAVVSVQNLEALAAGGRGGPRPMRLRLVARAGHTSEAAPTIGREVALARWGAAGCALAMVGAGAMSLYLAPLLGIWGCAALVPPALFATRLMCVAGPAGALAPSRTERAQLDARAAAKTRDMARWESATCELEALHGGIVDRFQLRPFRGLSLSDADTVSPSSREDLPRALPSTA